MTTPPITFAIGETVRHHPTGQVAQIERFVGHDSWWVTWTHNGITRRAMHRARDLERVPSAVDTVRDQRSTSAVLDAVRDQSAPVVDTITITSAFDNPPASSPDPDPGSGGSVDGGGGDFGGGGGGGEW